MPVGLEGSGRFGSGGSGRWDAGARRSQACWCRETIVNMEVRLPEGIVGSGYGRPVWEARSDSGAGLFARGFFGGEAQARCRDR